MGRTRPGIRTSRAGGLDDGRYELWLPYADATELVMDVLRYAGQVRGDAALRSAFDARIAAPKRRG